MPLLHLKEKKSLQTIVIVPKKGRCFVSLRVLCAWLCNKNYHCEELKT